METLNTDFQTVKVYENSLIERSPAEYNLDYAKNIVYQRENPNPMTIIFLILGILVLIFFMHTIFIKRNISGIWFGGSGESQFGIKYRIVYNPFTDALKITNTNGNQVNGILSGHTIWILQDGNPDMIGVLLSKNKILWVNTNEIWQNVKVLE